MFTRTKIICTIGPSVSSLESIKRLIQAGMSVARINFSHGTHEEHAAIISHIKEARKSLNKPVAIMLDTKGPEIRLGNIEGGFVFLNPGHTWKLVKKATQGNLQEVSINPGHILNDLSVGQSVLFDDGYISSKVTEISEEGVLVIIENGGTIKSGKGVNIPNAILNLPVMTETDVQDICFGCRQDIDIIAASFVRSADHVLEIKKLLAKENKQETLVFAKIENKEGVVNFDSIVQAADGIMVARGDLGVEVPLSQVPTLQKMMIRKSYLAGKPAITATQMLESMINNPRPTRAEASDVANAIYDSTSAVMLSGETAVGKYPLETVEMMVKIVEEAESHIDYKNFFTQHYGMTYHDVTSAITLASVKTAYNCGAQAIFAFTSGGTSARLLSRLRPNIPIIAMTPNEKCYHQLAINWGVTPAYCSKKSETITEAFAILSDYALNAELVHYGDRIVMTAGNPFGVTGTTNTIIVENIGDILVRGHAGYGKRVHGNVTIVLAKDNVKPYMVKEKLLVITEYDDTYYPLVNEALGVILQNHTDDTQSEQQLINVAKELEKPVLIRADAACRILKEGQLATLDPERAFVHNRIWKPA